MSRLPHLLVLVACISTNLAIAQSTPSPARAENAKPAVGTISGQILDASTGLPVPGVIVDTPNGFRNIEVTTDPAGHYTLRGVPPGTITVSTAGLDAMMSRVSRTLTLAPGQDLTSIDLRVRTTGTISGKVVDEDRQPIRGVKVHLIAREYSWGALRYFDTFMGETDEQGHFQIGSLEPGRSYLILARDESGQAAPNLPADPAERRQLKAPTYYPHVTEVDGATPLILRPGELREGVDITMLRSPSFCVAGQALAEGSKSSATPFAISIESPGFVSGSFGHQNMRIIDMNPPLYKGQTGSDGKFRVCNLPQGTWRIWVTQGTGIDLPWLYGSAVFSFTDSDIRNLNLEVGTGKSLDGEVVLDAAGADARPAKAGSGRPGNMALIVALQSLHAFRTMSLSLRPWVRAPLPGAFSLSGVFADDYAATVSGLQGNMYIKDLTYGGRSVLREIIHTESASMGTPMRVVVGNDGGFIEAKSTSRDGNPLGGKWITIIPANANSETEVAGSHLSGQTDQTGTWKSAALAPGKYFVLATGIPVDMTPETLKAIVAERLRTDPVVVAPNATVATIVVEKDLE